MSIDALSEQLTAVVEELRRGGLNLDRERVRALESYLRLVRRRGGRVNLVSSGDLERLPRRHLLESFNLAHTGVPLSAGRLADLGSGAGFPAIPLAIWQQGLHVQLVEPVERKAQFLAMAIRKLRLAPRVGLVAERVEHLAPRPEHRGRYDVVTARGVGPLDRTARWAASLLRPGGWFVAFKGTRLESELARVVGDMDRLTLSVADVLPLRWGNGRLLVIRKAPRSSGESMGG